jgi:hypothetical protein
MVQYQAAPPATSADSSNDLGIGISLRIFDRKTGEQKLDTGLLKVTLPAATGSLAYQPLREYPSIRWLPGSIAWSSKPPILGANPPAAPPISTSNKLQIK